jgi:hypothetical protein
MELGANHVWDPCQQPLIVCKATGASQPTVKLNVQLIATDAHAIAHPNWLR